MRQVISGCLLCGTYGLKLYRMGMLVGMNFNYFFGLFIVKILSALRSLFSNDFHYTGTDCIIGMKIPFSNWRLKSSNGRVVRNHECWLGCYLHKPKVETLWNTKLLAAVGFNWFDIRGNFSQFLGTFLVHLQQSCFKKLFFMAFKTNRLLLDF